MAWIVDIPDAKTEPQIHFTRLSDGTTMFKVLPDGEVTLISLVMPSQTANQAYMSPDGANGAPTFRALVAADIASGVLTPARLGSGSGGSTKFLREDSTFQTIPTTSPGGANTQVQYNNAGAFGGSGNWTFNGTDWNFNGSGFAYFNNPYVMMLGTGLYVGGDGYSTGMYFRGGSIGANTYADFQFQAGGGSREFKLLNQLSSRYALFVSGGSDAQNATNTFVGIGSTAPIGKFHVQQSNAAYSTIVAEGASGQTGRLLALVPFGAGSYLTAFDYAGNLAIGHGDPAGIALNIIKTTEQLRVGYSATQYDKTEVSSAGVVTHTIVGTSPKRVFANNVVAPIEKRVRSQANVATLTPNIGSYDTENLTAQAQNLTVANPTGTPTDAQQLTIRIINAGAGGWTLTFGTAYGGSLPANTSASGFTDHLVFEYYASGSSWILINQVVI